MASPWKIDIRDHRGYLTYDGKPVDNVTGIALSISVPDMICRATIDVIDVEVAGKLDGITIQCPNCKGDKG